MPYDDREPQRFLGMPVQPGSWRLPADDTRPRVLGVPRSWFTQKPVDLRWLRHPYRWTRWRLAVHRLGAFAPPYSEPGEDR